MEVNYPKISYKICKTVNCRHDVAQIAGLTAMSFGQEDVDRYIVVYKKDHAPSEDEVFARRNGESEIMNFGIISVTKIVLTILFVLRMLSYSFERQSFFCLIYRKVHFIFYSAYPLMNLRKSIEIDAKT